MLRPAIWLTARFMVQRFKSAMCTAACMFMNRGRRWSPLGKLPAENPHFAGRTSDLAKLDTLLHEARSGIGEISVAVLDGLAGVGKTTLAISWAQQCGSAFS